MGHTGRFQGSLGQKKGHLSGKGVKKRKVGAGWRCLECRKRIPDSVTCKDHFRAVHGWKDPVDFRGGYGLPAKVDLFSKMQGRGRMSEKNKVHEHVWRYFGMTPYYRVSCNDEGCLAHRRVSRIKGKTPRIGERVRFVKDDPEAIERA